MIKINRGLILLFVFLLFITLSLFIFSLKRENNSVLGINKEKEIINNKNYHSLELVEFDNFNEEIFLDSVRKTNLNQVSEATSRIGLGVVPHHLLASDLITDFFEKISEKNNFEDIILVGPNHFERGSSNLTSCLGEYKNSLGSLSTNVVVIDDLTENKKVDLNCQIVSDDHTVSSLVPFIQHYYPKSKLTVILFKKATSIEEIDLVKNSINNQFKKGNRTLVLGSIDFSHYLDGNSAQIKNQETIDQIKKFNYDSILKMENDNLDSPASLALILKLAQALSFKEINILSNTNSYNLFNLDPSNVTSYLTLTFSKKQ